MNRRPGKKPSDITATSAGARPGHGRRPRRLPSPAGLAGYRLGATNGRGPGEELTRRPLAALAAALALAGVLGASPASAEATASEPPPAEADGDGGGGNYCW